MIPVHDLLAGADPVGIGARGAGKFGIGSDGGEAMAGDVHFRQDIDKTVFGILHQFPDIVLRIKTTVVFRLIGRRSVECPKSPYALYIPGADLG